MECPASSVRNACAESVVLLPLCGWGFNPHVCRELQVSLWGLHTKTAKLVNKQRAGPTVFHALWRCLRADYADAQQHFDAIWASRVHSPAAPPVTLSPAPSAGGELRSTRSQAR